MGFGFVVSTVIRLRFFLLFLPSFRLVVLASALGRGHRGIVWRITKTVAIADDIRREPEGREAGRGGGGRGKGMHLACFSSAMRGRMMVRRMMMMMMMLLLMMIVVVVVMRLRKRRRSVHRRSVEGSMMDRRVIRTGRRG